MDYGIKISKDGYNVMTADDNELVFSSEFKTHKIKYSGTATITISSGNTSLNSVVVSHSLGYIPTAEVYVSNPSLAYDEKLPISQSSVSVTVNGDPSFDWKINSSSLTIYAQHSTSYGASVTYTFSYIIFVDKIV